MSSTTKVEYTSVRLPKPLVRTIKNIIADPDLSGLGFSSIQEFVEEAVRHYINLLWDLYKNK